jgi:hypothetical protein
MNTKGYVISFSQTAHHIKSKGKGKVTLRLVGKSYHHCVKLREGMEL